MGLAGILSVEKVPSLTGLISPYFFPGTTVPGFHMPPLRGWFTARLEGFTLYNLFIMNKKLR